MFYVLFNKGLPVRITKESPFTGTPQLKEFPGLVYDKAEARWDWDSFEYVDALALRLTSMTGVTYLAVDSGPSVSPRFDIVEAPKVGDLISYGFNGDYYPCGAIERITKNWQVTSTEGKNFRRRKNSGCWKMTGGTWSMVGGHRLEQNPSF